MLTLDEIKQYVEAHKEEALQCLVDALQSPSPTGSELPMAQTMMKWIDKIGIQVQVHEYMKDRPNLIAEWKGSEEGKTFLFNGHMDVFPPTETDDADYNPWSGEIRDGQVFGRGASDMKGGDCAALMSVKFLKDMGYDPKGSVVLNYVSDEERGGEFGVLPLLREGLLKGDFGISMEPTDMNMLVGHGGTYPCKVVVFGDGGHASYPIKRWDKDNIYGGEDAIKKAMKAVAALNRLQDEVIDKKPETFYGKSHLAVTMIRAGLEVNNYPRRAEIMIDRRYMPFESPESVDAEIIGALDEIKKTDPTFAYEYQAPFEPATPVFEIPEDSSIVQTLDEACEKLLGAKPVHMTKVSGADAAYIKRDIGTMMPWFGPGTFDNIANATESVPIDNYLNCIIIYMYTIVSLLSA